MEIIKLMEVRQMELEYLLENEFEFEDLFGIEEFETSMFRGLNFFKLVKDGALKIGLNKKGLPNQIKTSVHYTFGFGIASKLCLVEFGQFNEKGELDGIAKFIDEYGSLRLGQMKDNK